MKEDKNSGCGTPIFFGVFTFIVTLIKTGGTIGESLVAGIGSVIFVYFLMRIF